MGFPGSSDSKERPGFDPWVRKIPWRRERLPTPKFLPGKFQGQRSLMGYSPWGCKESDMTEWLTLSLFIPKIVRFFPSYLLGILHLCVIHSELIFVESVRSVSRGFFLFFFFFPETVQLFQCYLLTKLSLIHCISFASLLKIRLYLWGSISGFSFLFYWPICQFSHQCYTIFIIHLEDG